MSAVAVLRLPMQTNLSGFVAMLQRLQVPHRVAEESGEQVLWVPGEALAVQVRELYAQYPHGSEELQLAADKPQRSMPGFVEQIKRNPVTSGVLLITFIVAAITLLGDNFETVRWFSFVDFQIKGDYIYFASLAHTMDSGQWWRLLTPMLLHFGFLHLAMNSLWYWELGRRIESYQGPLMLIALTLVFGLASNVAQYQFGGPSLFGGLSGVLYGLLGHCWIYQRLAPNAQYRLPPGVLIMMLAWLLICMTGIFELLQFGSIANAAHVGGLVAGCATGLVGGLLARARR
ncbi:MULTISPECIES: rhomboid family intramembrane serine protease [Pseudomonas]|uniref:rhomboid family intramembrane serine protease n=1 Tax=Pseudomonas TaxID=286 RepID=UPI0008545F41|nr:MULTISPECIES: rhomboid family intramembrane serine protease [Pseudomonas]MAB97058.1 rhomboid family intramembrane serine protease [Pseudomonadaceae bacterium]NRH29495.1 rhomboid family intramembrane serine protease [Pseudomonas sp. MS19]OEO26408.1 rhomboid family intramembrane serine protease [Pseudomonas sp. J237]